jgi:hypothetical protein
MPVLSLPLNAAGNLVGMATVDVLVTVSLPRAAHLQHTGQAVPAPVSGRAFLDTGSVYTLVDAPILAGLGLTTPAGQLLIVSANGQTTSCPRFDIGLTIVHPQQGPQQNLVLPSVPVLAVPLAGFGVEAVIGCDILSQCLFVYDGPAGGFALAY